MSSASSSRELDIEAAIQRSIAAIPGAQLYKESTSPAESGPYAPPEDDDQTHFRKYRETKTEDVDAPSDVDLINNWTLLEKSAPSDASTSGSIPVHWQEPSAKMGKDGLPEPHVCQYCQHIVIRCNASREVERILVARSREELQRAAKQGCILLEWLGWHLYGQLFNPPSDQSEISFVFEPLDGCEEFLSAVRGEFVDWGPNRKGQRGKGEFGPFSVVTPYEDPASDHVRDRPVNLVVDSDKNFATAKEWIRFCHEWHPECRHSYEVDLPSRLLSISGDFVKLVRTAGLSDDSWYVALSYCWGGEQEKKTTKRNLRQRERDGLRVAELPKTLQDAVEVTKQLGLPYLWIDSLCIVQDDMTHKTEEVAKMGDIYSGAFVTILAASSRSAQDGFLQDRTPSAIRRHTAPIQFQCDEGEWGEEGEMGWAYLNRPETYDPRKEEPLNDRAWALQEYLLSSRLLIYGSWQMRWVCRERQESDGGPDHVYPRSFEKLIPKLQSTRTCEVIRQEGLLALDEGRMTKSYHCMKEMDDIIDLWPILVEEFTSRKLSLPSDRSAAMYGIATSYATLCSDDGYAAGLWATNIARQLLWKRPRNYDYPVRKPASQMKDYMVEASDPRAMNTPAYLTRHRGERALVLTADSDKNRGISNTSIIPEHPLVDVPDGDLTAVATASEPGSRLPTWSWISVDGKVTWPSSLASKKPQLEVLRCDTAKFGPLGAAGYVPLTVRGRLREAFYRKSSSSVLHFSGNMETLKEPIKRTREANARSHAHGELEDLALTANAVFDYQDEDSGTSDSVKSIFLLEILPYGSAEHEKSEVRPAGIILRLNQSGETYQRIGYFDFEWPNGVWLTLHNSGSRGHDERRRRFEKEAFAGCSMKVVTII